MNKIITCLICALLALGVGGCSKSNNIEKIEKVLLDNDYKIGVTNTVEQVYILRDQNNYRNGWIFENPDKLSYENSGIASFIINAKNGEYTNVSIYEKVIEIEKTSAFLRDLSEPDATDALKKELLNDNTKELDNMNISLDDLIVLAKDMIENYDPSKIEKDDQETNKNTTESKTKEFYTVATTLKRRDLDNEDLGLYSYNDITFTSDDCKWIDNPINKEGTINQGAFYRKMATSLEGFKLGFNNGTQISEHILGFKTSSKEEFQPYADDLSTYIVEKDSLKPVMNKFSTLGSIESTFNTDANSYEFTIKDLSACAKELKISEEMLGYILAMLDEYAPAVSFKGDSYSFKLN